MSAQLRKDPGPCRAWTLTIRPRHGLPVARAVGQLLISPAAAANTDVESSLDDFLGAVYTLIRAKHEGFRDRPGRPIAIKPIAHGAARIAAGNLKTDDL